MRRKDKQINGVIYRTTNTINGKWYIGKDENNNPEYLGSGIALSRAIAKHGRHCFRKEILAEASTRFELAELEKEYIQRYDAASDPMSYNIASGGYGGNTIAGFNDKQKEQFAQKTRDRWATMSSEERALFISVVSKTHKGKPKTAEHKAKISSAKTGVPRDREVSQKISETMKAKYASGELYVPRHAPKYSEKELRKMKQAYDNGTPVSELQKIYKLSRTTIYKYLR